MVPELEQRLADLEAALRASEGRYEEVIASLEALDAGVIYYDPTDRLVFCNARLRDMYREIADCLVPGTHYAEIARRFVRAGLGLHQDWDEDDYVSWLMQQHKTPDPAGYEVAHRDNTWLLIWNRRTANGGLIGLRVDITQRKAVEVALASSEQRFKSLLEMSSDWYWEQDAEFRFTYLSEGHFKQVGEDSAERLGLRRWDVQLSGVTEDQWVEHRRALAAHRSFRNFEYQWRASDGRRFYVSVSGDPVFDGSGTFVGYRGTGTDITQRKAYETRIKELAEYDFLTGLPNRILLNARFEQAELLARRSGQLLALLFIDLDRFKNINDSLGHPVGDKLLAETAQRLQSLVRATDTVSRHGGDEFLILLNNVGDPANAGRVAEQILAELARPYRIAGHELIVTPSVGITIWPTDAQELSEMVRQADMAMYHSKSMGRNQYSFFRDEMNTRVHERLTLENALRRAVQHGEFYLEYQPVFDLRSRRVISAEALLRWEHPALGQVSPTRFIPIAEDTGLIVPIGNLVIEKVCEYKQRLASSPHDWLPVAINLSAVQLRDRHLLDLLSARFRQHGLKPGALELEITESLLLSESESAVGMLRALRVEGMRLVIDDFGTGYSNLGFLRKFAIDKLKIDQSFIRDIPADYNAMALARGIIGLAKSIGLRTVAEGIETQAQLEFLVDAGCDEGQGFLLARPGGGDTLIELLDAQYEAEQSQSLRRRFLSHLRGG